MNLGFKEALAISFLALGCTTNSETQQPMETAKPQSLEAATAQQVVVSPKILTPQGICRERFKKALENRAQAEDDCGCYTDSLDATPSQIWTRCLAEQGLPFNTPKEEEK